MKKIMGQFFNEELLDDIFSQLSKREDAFKHFTLPECGDCSRCALNASCSYDKWKEVSDKSLAKFKKTFINQEGIGEII